MNLGTSQLRVSSQLRIGHYVEYLTAMVFPLIKIVFCSLRRNPPEVEKSLHEDNAHHIANFYVIVLNIFSNEIVFNNTKKTSFEVLIKHLTNFWE